MKRRLFHLAVAVSLFICVAAGGLWLDSFQAVRFLRYEDVQINPNGWSSLTIEVTGGAGGIVVAIKRTLLEYLEYPMASEYVKSFPPQRTFQSDRYPSSSDYPTIAASSPSIWNRLGFYAERVDKSISIIGVPAHNQVTVIAPLLAIFLTSAILPTVAYVRWQRARRRSPTACTNCGYDLRATPDRCPECGTIPADQ